MRWRTGRHVGIHLYEQRGASPHDLDRPLGTFLRPDDAELACDAVNDHNTLLVLRARVADAVELIKDLRRDTVWQQEDEGLRRLETLLTGTADL